MVKYMTFNHYYMSSNLIALTKKPYYTTLNYCLMSNFLKVITNV